MVVVDRDVLRGCWVILLQWIAITFLNLLGVDLDIRPSVLTVPTADASERNLNTGRVLCNSLEDVVAESMQGRV